MGPTQERTGRWTSPRYQFLKGINTISYDRCIHRVDWRLSYPDWEGWRGGKKKKKKKLLHEIIARFFDLPRSLQSDNGTSFTSKVTQGVSKALGITYLHCAWRPQSSGKVERANQFLKSVIKKITQETSLGWKQFTNSSPPHPYYH